MIEGQQGFCCGFVALAGAPNSGKSTLLNHFLDFKAAITSAKPQTTRTRILGVWTGEKAQIIFLDTPGIHPPRSKLHQVMVQAALKTLPQADAIVWLVDVARPRPEDEALVLDSLRRIKKPVLLALNKIDLVRKPALLPMIDRFARLLDFAAVVPISARRGDGLEALREELIALMPPGGPLFPAEMITDQPERVLAAEFIREKVIRLTRQEVPYGVAVEVTDFTERPGGQTIFIRAEIVVARESHRGIIIGAKGARLKEIGQAAREEIERLLGAKVFLELFVRVDKDWVNQEAAIQRLGYQW